MTNDEILLNGKLEILTLKLSEFDNAYEEKRIKLEEEYEDLVSTFQDERAKLVKHLVNELKITNVFIPED